MDVLPHQGISKSEPYSLLEYWDRKILGWERSRYDSIWAGLPSSWSVRARRTKTQRLLSHWMQSTKEPVKTIDLGCGSGYLLDGLNLSSLSTYIGVDLSPRAISAAKVKYPKHTFVCANLTELQPVRSDVIVALGLLDWIEPDNLWTFLKNSHWEKAIVSYTSSGLGLKSAVYWWYRKLFDLSGIRAKSYSNSYIEGALNKNGLLIEAQFADWTLKPGNLLVLSKKRPD